MLSNKAGALAISAVVAAAALILTTPRRAPACTLTIASGTTSPGGLLMVPISLQSQSTATGIQFDMAFDSSTLGVSTIAGPSSLSTRRNPQASQLNDQVWRVIVIDPQGNALPDGVLVNLFIRPAATAKTGTYPIAIKSSTCTNASADPLPVNTQSGSVTILSTSTSAPVLTSDSMLNAASFLPGAITAGEAVTLIGSFPASSSPRLVFGGAQAIILYNDSNQINAVVPDGLPASGQTDVKVFLDDIEVSSFNVALSPAAPGVFTRNMGGTGYATALNEDGSVNMPTTPATRGSTVTVWITGVRPLGQSGASASERPLSVAVGGQPATLIDTIPVPDNPALVQIRFTVPPNAPLGPAIDLSISAGDAVSQAAVWISIS